VNLFSQAISRKPSSINKTSEQESFEKFELQIMEQIDLGIAVINSTKLHET
jgi:hypothetical protein